MKPTEKEKKEIFREMMREIGAKGGHPSKGTQAAKERAMKGVAARKAKAAEKKKAKN